MELEYINNKVRPILEVLLDSLLENLPDDPLLFMYEWLQKYNNHKSEKREELERLRKLIKTKNNNENSNFRSQNNKKESKSKLKNSNNNSAVQSSESEKEEESNDDFMQKINERRLKLTEKGGRSGISAEAFGKFNKKEKFKPRVIPKTEEQKLTIKNRVMNCFIFENLDDQDMNTIIDACEQKKFKNGEYVIKQGDNGDEIYLIESGELDCEKIFEPGDAPKYLKTYKPGELFGELALLYNAPRAATIFAKTDCVLWALDRATFTNIVKESAINNREKYKKFLESIPILSQVTSYELYSICDAIKKEKVKKDEYIIKEGEEGNKFYILDEGSAIALKTMSVGKKPEKVKDYSKGDYFGELALLKNEPRAASVLAVTDCRLLSMDRPAFKRLLGPLEEILKRNSAEYEKYTSSG